MVYVRSNWGQVQSSSFLIGESDYFMTLKKTEKFHSAHDSDVWKWKRDKIIKVQTSEGTWKWKNGKTNKQTKKQLGKYMLLLSFLACWSVGGKEGGNYCRASVFSSFQLLILCYKYEIGAPSGVPADIRSRGSSKAEAMPPSSALHCCAAFEERRTWSPSVFTFSMMCQITLLFYREGNIPWSPLSILKDKSVICKSLFSSSLALWLL